MKRKRLLCRLRRMTRQDPWGRVNVQCKLAMPVCAPSRSVLACNLHDTGHVEEAEPIKCDIAVGLDRRMAVSE